MFEKEIKFIADVNLNKIKNLGSFITFEKFDNSDVHPAIKQYISAELDYLIHDDRKKLLEQSVFDYSGPEVSKYFNFIAQELKKNKKISYEDIKKLLLQAVSFNVNYIVRPKWSLTKLVYNESGVKSVEEIKLNLNYVYFYDYIKSILNTYLSKRKLVSLSTTEFEMILDRIDKEIFLSDEKKLIDFTLYTMAEFFNLGAANKKLILPYGVELFLKEKNQTDKVIRLKKSYIDGSKQAVDIEEIRKIIYSDEPMEYENNVQEQQEELAAGGETESLNLRNIRLKDDFEEKVIENPEPEIKEELKTDEEYTAELEIVPEDSIDKIDEGLFASEILESTEDHNDIVNTGDEASVEEPVKTVNEEEAKEEKSEPADENEQPTGIEDETELSLDDSFLSFYETELKSLEDDISGLNISDEEVSELTGKNDLDSLYDFEEESSDLLKDFKVEEEKPEEAEVPDTDTEDEANSAVEELDIMESEELTREFLIDEEAEPEEESEEPEKIQTEKNVSTRSSRKKKDEDIFDYLSNKDIEKIVANVFNDDREDFANTMEKLAECSSYEEATEILKSVFLTYRVNPYSKEAVILTNSVSNYFELG